MLRFKTNQIFGNIITNEDKDPYLIRKIEDEFLICIKNSIKLIFKESNLPSHIFDVSVSCRNHTYNIATSVSTNEEIKKIYIEDDLHKFDTLRFIEKYSSQTIIEYKELLYRKELKRPNIYLEQRKKTKQKSGYFRHFKELDSSISILYYSDMDEFTFNHLSYVDYVNINCFEIKILPFAKSLYKHSLNLYTKLKY